MRLIEGKGSRRIVQKGDLWKFLSLPIQSYYFRIKVGTLPDITTFKTLNILLSVDISFLLHVYWYQPLFLLLFPIKLPHTFIYYKLTKLYKENSKLNLSKSKPSKKMILKMKIIHDKKMLSEENIASAVCTSMSPVDSTLSIG